MRWKGYYFFFHIKIKPKSRKFSIRQGLSINENLVVKRCRERKQEILKNLITRTIERNIIFFPVQVMKNQKKIKIF